MNGYAFLAWLDQTGFNAAQYSLTMLWQSSLLFAAVGFLCWLLRRRRAAVRHALWATALLLTPLIPVITSGAAFLGAPQRPVFSPPEYTVQAPAVRTVTFAPVAASQDETAKPVAAAVSQGATVQGDRRLPNPLAFPWALALVTYMAGAGVFLVLLIVGRLRVWQLLRRARPASDARTRAAFRRAGERLALRGTCALLETGRLRAPVCVGAVRSRVLLPEALAALLSAGELEAAALHETAHLRRRDPLLNTAAMMLRAVFFFHPWVWLAGRRMALLAEQAADEAVLDATREPLPYARLLARLAEILPARAPVSEMAAGLVFRKSAFLRRMEAILSERREAVRRMTRGAMAGVSAALVATACLAASLPLIGKAGSDLPKAYEKAEGHAGGRARVGPNTVTLETIVRNDRDGRLHVASEKETTDIAVEPWVIEQAAWMDVAHVDLGLDAELFDIIELRVFDHETREMLWPSETRASAFDAAWPSGDIQMRSLGGLLPDRVDIWMRVHSYEKNAPVVRLAAKKDAGAEVGGGTLKVLEIHAGGLDYDARAGGFQPADRDERMETSVLFEFTGQWNEGRWQICAVAEDGTKAFPGVPHFLDFNVMGGRQPIHFPMALKSIARFELRPFGGRHRFYFDGVQLPAPSGKTLERPPAFAFEIDGREGEWVSNEIKPVHVRLVALRGRVLFGVAGRQGASYLVYPSGRGPTTRLDSEATIGYEIRGLGVSGKPRLACYDREGNPIEVGRSGARSSGAASAAGYFRIPVPLERIHRVELRLDPGEPEQP